MKATKLMIKVKLERIHKIETANFSFFPYSKEITFNSVIFFYDLKWAYNCL